MFEDLRKLLTNDFEKELLNEAVNNLNSDAKIRFSNFAFVIRELIDILLKELANDKNIKQCVWYEEPQKGERKIIRCHRIKYIIQGGFVPGLFDLLLSFDFNEAIRNINSYFRDKLSSNVHLTPECLNYTKDEIERKASEFESIIKNFILMIENIRQQILDFIVDEMTEIVTDNFLSEMINDLDILSTHTRIDSVNDIEVSINTITFDEVVGTINGNVNVFLQYGSDREISNGDGCISESSYPFELSFTIDISPLNDLFNSLSQDELNDKNFISNQFMQKFRNATLENLNIDIENVYINTDSFYE